MQHSDYRLPAEWEKQSGVMITWPHSNTDWADKMTAIESFFIELSNQILQYERLLIIANNEQHLLHIKSLLSNAQVNFDNLVVHIADSNDTWTRDYGPICLANNNSSKLLNFIFNGWGNKFDARLDNQINSQLLADEILTPTTFENFDFVLEGGSIDSDGNGCLLTTADCLLSPERNPNYNQEQINQFLMETFNLKKVHWLNSGYLAGDDTDSHIDMLARFTDENTIVYTSCNDPSDEHFTALKAMEKELQNLRNSADKAYNLKALPIPHAIFNSDNERLPASYANFLIINGAVLVPVYDDPHDEVALKVLQSCFSERKIIAINALAAILQSGSLHCLTMQLPEGVLN